VAAVRPSRPTSLSTLPGSRPSRRRAQGDAGQVLPLIGVVLIAAVVLALGVARLGVVMAERARAHTAADAAALAGVVEGREAAVAIAIENGASVVAFDRRLDEVEVRVRVGAAEAVARARLKW